MNWNEKLCGHVVTPEGWIGGQYTKSGVVSVAGRLHFLCHTDNDADGRWFNVYQHHCPNTMFDEFQTVPVGCGPVEPVYPPVGWNGLSEDEILAAVMPNPLESLDDDEMYATFDVYSKQNQFIDICLDGHLNEKMIPPLILALQNAQVLAARLREGRNDAS